MMPSSIRRPSFRALALCGGLAFLAACGNANDIGPAQSPPGQMGTDISPSRADVPIKNSQSTPVQRPD
jgi:hypothetical protein